MGVLALLAPLIPTFINAAEKLFAGKPKSGTTDKGPMVLQWLQAAATQIMAAKLPLPDGTVPTEHPTDDAIRGAIEAILQQMTGTGKVSANVATGDLYLVRLVGTPTKLQ